MQFLWQFLVAHEAAILAGLALVLKWVYNAWTPGVTFPEFLRTFIGEVVQEAPDATAQRKALAVSK